MRGTCTAVERHLGPLALIVALAGCAQFPPATADGDADGDADADVPPIDCGAGLTAISLNHAGSRVANGFSYSGTIAAGSGVAESSCNTESGNEVVFAFVPEVAGDLVVDTFGSDPSLDTMLHVRSQCASADTEIDCNEDWWYRGGWCYLAALEIDGAASVGIPLYVFVDTWSRYSEGDFVVTARSRPRVAAGAGCDPAGLSDRCEDGFRCVDGSCQASQGPMLTEVAALNMPDGRTLRLVLRGTDAEQDVVDAHFIFNIPPSTPLDWTQRLDPIEWEGASFLSITDWDVSLYPATTTVEIAVIDSAGTESAPRSATAAPLPRRDLGQPCDPTEYLDWCQDGQVCNAGTCAASQPPTLTDLVVHNLTATFRATVMGTDPDGNATGVHYTFIDAGNADMPDPTYGIDIYANFAWSVRDETTFTAGFETIATPAGAAGLRVEIVDYAFNESASIRVQGTAMPQLAAGGACDPAALANQCPETCSRASSQCVDMAACQGQACAQALPALTPGTPERVRLHTFDPGCFTSTCGVGVGPEAIYTLDVPSRSRLSLVAQARLGMLWDVALSVRTVCEAVETEQGCGNTLSYFPGCAWDFTPPTVHDWRTDFAGLVIDSLDPGTYFVIADSLSGPGDFELLAELTPL